MVWKDAFAARKEVILATASKAAIPRAIVVTSLGFSGDKLLIGICQMRKSLETEEILIVQSPCISS